MKNIYLIPTEKPSRLYYSNKNLELLLSKEPISFKTFERSPQNIYITSDEEIRDCYVVTDLDKIVKVDKTNEEYYHKHNSSKIILTTDTDLIDDGVQSISDDFLEWFVSKANDSGKPIDIIEVRKEKYSERFDNDKSPIGNPDTWGNRWVLVFPKEEITFEEVFGKEKKKGLKKFIDKYKQKQHLIDMMQDDEELGLYDEPKQETLEELSNEYAIGKSSAEIFRNAHKRDFIAGFKACEEQNKNMYSEEEVIAFGEFIFKHSLLTHTKGVKSLFEQFKKK